MKKSLVLYLLLLSIYAFGQGDKKFKFGLSINPSISNNIISNNGKTPNVVANIFRGIEKPAFAYQVNVFSEYNLNVKSKLRVGFGFSKTAYKTSKRKTSTAVPDPKLPEYSQFIWQHQDIVIPILYSKYFKKGTSKFYFIGGLAPLIKINRIVKFKEWFADGSSDTESNNDNSLDFKKLNVNLLLGIGYDINISSKNRIFIQPTFDCNILGINNQANLNRRIYSIGLTVGTIIN